MSASVLIVQDNSSIREPLAAQLRLKGYVVLESSDGTEALGYLRQLPKPALILLDLMMPVMDDWSFLERKARDSAIARLPVVLLSAAANLQSRRRMPDVVATVEKPVDMPSLLAQVDRICNAGLDRAASFLGKRATS